MKYQVVFAPEAEEQLVALYNHISDAASPNTAERYVGEVIDYCAGLTLFPLRGTRRDEIRPNLRIINYKKTTIIAFEVGNSVVTVLGIYYGGQDFTAILRDS